MRIVVTGRHGQLVQSLLERQDRAGAAIVPVGRPELDLALPGDWLAAIAPHCPDIIVLAAAYTAVDKAESEPDLANIVNGEAPGRLAAVALALGVPLIHISTDYVFDGSKPEPWTEQDAPAPINVYGRTKLAGETAVLAASPDNVVLRVGWLYSPFGTNFAKTILRLAGERDTIRVVADQLGRPSSASDIADGVLQVAANVLEQPGRRELRGVFHMAPQGETSWAGFARAICDHAQRRGRRDVAIEDIATSAYPTPARRPANSRLDGSRLAAVHGITLPEWRSSLASVLDRLL